MNSMDRIGTHHFKEQGFENKWILKFRLCFVIFIFRQHGGEPHVVSWGDFDGECHEECDSPSESR